MNHVLMPKLYLLLKEEGYCFADFLKDMMAGVIVGILTLPMSIALAIASGVRPERGLYTAIVAGFLIAVLGGSRVQISGPTGALVVLVYSVSQQFGYDGLVIATIIAGFILIAMGCLRFGSVIKFVPYPVIVGFTSALAVVLFSGQVKDMLGLELPKFPIDFVERWSLYFTHLSSMNFYSLLISLLGVAIVVFWPKISTKVPGALIAIVASSLLVYFLPINVETIGDRYGEIPSNFPPFRIPRNLGWEEIMKLVSPAMAIAILAGMESLLSAVVADGMTGKRHSSDMELIGQGVGNIFSALFGGIPATGSIGRTATNIRNGARTPIAAVIHVLTVLVILMFLGRFVKLVPMATLGAIVAVVAYNMCEWRHFTKLFLNPKQDILILLTTFFLTLFVDLLTGIVSGVVLAAFLFMQNMSANAKGMYMKKERKEKSADALALPDEIDVFEIEGPFFFAAVEKFKVALKSIHYAPKVLIMRLDNVPMIDTTGVRLLEEVWAKCVREKTILLFSGAQKHVLEVFRETGFIEKIGKDAIFHNLNDALQAAYTFIEDKTKANEVSA